MYIWYERRRGNRASTERDRLVQSHPSAGKRMDSDPPRGQRDGMGGSGAETADAMTKEAQMRVLALLKAQWRGRVSVEQQSDGGLVIHLSCAGGSRTVLVIEDESSPLLRMIGLVYISPLSS